MIRWTIAGLIVVGLIFGVWLIWPRDQNPSSTTTPEAADTTTTESVSTTRQATTITTLDPLQVRDVETVEQAEAILRELMHGWFEGIYREDPARIRDVVATQDLVATAEDSFGVEFDGEPELEDITFRSSELLRADSECIAIWTVMQLTGFREGEAQNVHILRWTEGGWRMLSSWLYRDDLWEADCDAQLLAS